MVAQVTVITVRATNCAALPMSLAFFDRGWRSSETRSTVASIAELSRLDDQRQQAHRDHQRAFAATDVEEEGHRNQHHVEQHQLAEGGFTAEGGEETCEGIAGGVEDTLEAGLAFEGGRRHVGFSSIRKAGSLAAGWSKKR